MIHLSNEKVENNRIFVLVVHLYLDFDIIDSLSGTNDWPAYHRWECVQRKIGTSITTFYKLDNNNYYYHYNQKQIATNFY